MITLLISAVLTSFIVGFLTPLYINKANTKSSICILNYAWITSDGIKYGSTEFYTSITDNRKAIIIGKDPDGFNIVDHMFYHKVINPFLNKQRVDDLVDFRTKESTIRSLQTLRLMSIPMAETKDVDNMSAIKDSKPKTITKDNVVFLDFSKHDT